MTVIVAHIVVVVILALIALKLSIRVLTGYEMGVLFRPDRMPKVRWRTITMPIQWQGIITRENVSVDIRESLDVRTVDWGVEVTGVELKGLQLADSMKNVMAHPLALQLRNLQSLIEIGVDKNTTVFFPPCAPNNDKGSSHDQQHRCLRNRPAAGAPVESGTAAPHGCLLEGGELPVGRAALSL
ncbi:hypothetical protein [Arthrobacter psychrochitiniphilus]|uniref:hypothetical protein n=1 Tax=Arthrobacter psychrochitiniphilus TaxID=291045 RepID=UPI0017D2F1C6|nr:hypothetical protein [Arthrobacter psychrochitiniphilus]NYG17193.1 hypothetical protein [Arthrobacter psychrochitiniphilus]